MTLLQQIGVMEQTGAKKKVTAKSRGKKAQPTKKAA